ncbi:MAG TPA: SprT family zinc-dependent metalloprotease [Bryobacteraceae bacterium]|nr:SprT family zinc-dependent metalloprotease [Bryobacteraceae bacterium]
MSSARERRALVQGRTYVRTLARLWQHPSLADVSLVLAPRLSRSAGRCLPTRSSIELSAATLDSALAFRREVLCHEAAHAVVWARHGRKARPHGPEWQALMRQAGFEPRASLILCGRRAKRSTTTRFRHTCPVCHFSRTAKRRMTSWRCPECQAIGLDGELRIQRIASRR